MLQGTQQGECEEIQQRIAAINNSGRVRGRLIYTAPPVQHTTTHI
jgi:hypothetical protein